MRHIIVLAVFAAIVTSAFTTVIVNGLIFGASSTSGEVVSLPAGGKDGQIQGDTDCDGDVDAVDGLGVLIDVAALEALAQQEPCTDISDVIPVGEGIPGPQGPQGEPGPVGPQGDQGPSGLSDLELVFETGPADSIGAKTALASCPEGKTVISGGAGVNPNPPETAISINAPVFGQDTWRATAKEVVPTSANWAVTAYAICANVAE